jgi:hypothetical protein
LLQQLWIGVHHLSEFDPLLWYIGLLLTWEQILAVTLMISVQIPKMTVHHGVVVVEVVPKLMFLLEGVSGLAV